ncbi:type IA DNA topoisomerase [Brumimicrobium aurantiacum]|uniref:DNA topoisomerase n=1 Tax=Brumimicrobium aurantiacum TaxID=1737063 RepID=A0A3E1EVV8_9FLAO|nr:type IA DNA topoisomerase [Brumimicrobium aurantiacum]RFC53691.1 type IA DNA topoisomerase [Brumimicrobium aurantiacum]
MKVCIAEKPSVAKDIANSLGANQRKDGYYEGNGYQVTWTFGHLCTLKEPRDYVEEWKYWNLRHLPMVPSKFGVKVIDDEGIQRQFQIVKRLLINATEIINCGDAGQEGEVIQRWVFLKSGSKAPIKRLWISSLTEEAIKEGFENLKDGEKFNNLYAAGSARAIGDWLLGINATRLFTKKFALQRQVLSIGRVQTPTLAMIVNRQLEIENFKPQDYWELRTVYRDTEFNSVLGKIKKKEKAEYALSKIKDEPFEITSFEQKEGKEKPPRLFDLTALQVETNKKQGYSADKTLKLIQSLYEKKLVTYPRVDTTYLPDDVYPKIPGILKNLEYYKELTSPLLNTKLPKSKQVFNNKKVTDHHAIIPTGVKLSGVTPEEQKVYDTITKRFIAVFYPDCKVSNTTVLGEVLKLEFKATGKQILSPGWRVVYQKDKSKSKNKDENLMPVFEKGEKGPHEARLDQKQTSPPKPYTEATLLRAMETAGKHVEDEEARELMKDNGIGRPSTRANIIETLFRRRYIDRSGKSIVATHTGVDLIQVIDNETLKSPELTGDWERKLRLIEKGEYQPAQFKKELIELVVNLTNEVLFNTEQKAIRILGDEEKEKEKKPKKKRAKTVKVNITELTCPSCKKEGFLEGKKAYGCAHYKEGCKFVIPFEFMGKKLSNKQLSDLITKGKTTKIKGFKKLGSEEKIDGKLELTSDFNVTLNSN